jgi:hypothetical protein
MELFLRPLDDPNGVTWSIIWSLVILLVGVGYYIYTILKLATEEMKHGSHDTTEQEELLQLPSDRDQQSSGRGHD